ncbi:MAG: ABC transporter ATP-binding protein [Lysobacterales bacterium]
MIEAAQLSKRYGKAVAVDAVSFRVEPGQVLGFLGPNGAGKTTTMRMLAGFLTPSAGVARICGRDVAHDPPAAQRQLGYLPEGAPSYGEMRVGDFLKFISDVRGINGARRRQRLDDVAERLDLTGVWLQTIDTLSKGFRRRVGLAQAIIDDPPVLILDEPTDGLDPNQKHEVRSLIHAMRDKTVIVSTHILEEVEAVCTRAIIINEGSIVADATPQALLAKSRYAGAISVRAAHPSVVRDRLLRLAGVAAVEVDTGGGRVLALARPGVDLYTEIEQMLRAEQVEIHELTRERGRLDDVFRALTRPVVASSDPIAMQAGRLA